MIFFKERLTAGKALSILGVAVSLAFLNYFENQAGLDDQAASVSDKSSNNTTAAGATL